MQALKTRPVLSSWLCNQSSGRGLCVQRQQLGFKNTCVIVLQFSVSLFLNVCCTSERTPGTYNLCAAAVPSPSAGPVLGLSLPWHPPVTSWAWSPTPRGGGAVCSPWRDLVEIIPTQMDMECLGAFHRRSVA